MSDDEDDQECLHTVQGILYQIKVEIERKLNVANQLKRKLGSVIPRTLITSPSHSLVVMAIRMLALRKQCQCCVPNHRI